MAEFSTTSLLGNFLTLRKARKEARERFLASRKAETFYRRQLNQVAAQIDNIVRGMSREGVVTDVAAVMRVLNRYADILTPWAESVAQRMLADVNRRDAAA